MAWFINLVAIVSSVACAAAINNILCIIRNYRAARTLGVPIRIIPFSPINNFWALIDRRTTAFCRRSLPFFFGGNNSFTRYNWRGWEVEDRYRSHAEMGDIWILVTPFKNWLYINDPEALMAVYRRGADFVRPLMVSEMLDAFGPNISTVDGERWKLMRRIATRCFNEQNNQIVWSETIQLAHDMLAYWTSKKSIPHSADDMRTLSLHVLSRAGFGKSFKFEGHDERRSASPSSNYKESLQCVLENLVLILGLGRKFLSIPWLPQKLRTVHEACVAFQTYMTHLYAEEKCAHNEAETSTGLTESEIYGTLFTFNFAGHDTTSHTFTFALYFLAAYPGVQDWLSEEINLVFGGRPPSEWDYRTDLPRLKRCHAVMFETLRLYTIVPSIKLTANKARSLKVGDKTYLIPPQTMVSPSYGSVQTDPRFWGLDSLNWKPSRWVKPAAATFNITGTATATPAAGKEDLNMPIRGAFLGWSEGIRDCPGRKFSQTEFVATIATLFKDWRVYPVPRDGETLDTARERVKDLIKTDSGYVLLLQMLHPERAPLAWRKG